jgi:hypothetical protein
MSGACSTNWGEEKLLLVICRKARGKETTRKTTTCGWPTLRWVLEIVLDGVDCVGLAQDGDQWKVYVNMAMKL